MPATPGVRTVSVTRLGVSVEKVVATMEMPRRLRTRSDMEIAAPLDLTKAGVRSHIGNIFGKLGVRDRARECVATIKLSRV